MAAVTSSELLAAAAARLKKASASDLPAYWTAVCADAAEASFAEVSSRLQRRGYSQAQILSCDQMSYWTRTLGLYLSLVNGLAGEEGFNLASVEAMDIRPQLKSVTLLVNGLIVSPEDSTGAVVGTGTAAISTGQMDIFDGPGPEFGGGDGRPTRW